MSSFGVLSTGFSKKTRQDIIDEVEASLFADIKPTLNTESTAILGQIIGVLADQISEDWDVLEDVYDSQYPDSAADASLDGVGAITGATRLPATESTVTLTVTGDNATLLTAGRQARVPAGGIFETLANATIVTATAWAITTAYSVGDIVRNDSPENIYVCVIAGTSAGSGGPTGEGTAIVDGTVTWRFLGDGEGSTTVAAEATVTGPVAGLAFQITEIVTAVSGWLGVTNQADATLGTNIETDAAFRIRRENLLTVSGKGTVDTIRAKLLLVSGVTEALVFENTTDITDGNGVPPHAIECVVLGGTDAAIAQAIFDDKAAGIETFGGDITEVIVDSQGTSHTINASRADPVEMFIDITVVTDGNYPADGDTQVAAALKALGDTHIIGDDVIYNQFLGETLTTADGVSGVIDVQVMTLDKRPVVVTSGSTETFALSDGQTLTVKVDGQSAEQTVTFNTGDFVDINNALAAEVALVITTDLASPAATGADAAGAVTITSDSGGTIEVTGGTANAVLNFPTSFTPTGTANITILSRQLATFDTSRINVTSV
jgi:uncharacterized phage protein gp47/JayE